MKVEFTNYGRWPEAYRCTAGAGELIVVTSVGPRILSLRSPGGPNLLYQDSSGFAVGAWRLYGGHRFTVAPEGAETYAPDNTPCQADFSDQELRLAAPTSTNGLRRVLAISADEGGQGFVVRHILENHGLGSWSGALWGVTCVSGSCQVIAPCPQGTLRFWPGVSGVAYRNCCEQESGHVVITPNGTRGKVGWYSDSSWIASLQPEAVFVIHCPEPPALEDCVDDGCNIEVFSCPEYVELETLSGRAILRPGEQAEHVQRWLLLAPCISQPDYSAVASKLARLCKGTNPACAS